MSCLAQLNLYFIDLYLKEGVRKNVLFFAFQGPYLFWKYFRDHVNGAKHRRKALEKKREVLGMPAEIQNAPK